jgi:Flp pilus assembly protein TadG
MQDLRTSNKNNQRHPGLFSRKRKGQGTLEFALASGVFLLLIFGIIEFGYLLYIYSSVFSAAREAARFGSTITNESNCAGMQAAATRIGGIVGVGATNTVIRYDHGPTDTRAFTALPLCGSGYTSALGDRVVVRITVPYNSLTGVLPSMTVTNTDARTIIKSVEVSGNFPTPPLITFTFTPEGGPTPTNTPITPTPTNTPVTPTLTNTPVTPTLTSTPVTPTLTNTPVTPTLTPTNTPITPTPTNTPVTPTPTDPPVPPCGELSWTTTPLDKSNKYTLNLTNTTTSTQITITKLAFNWTSNGNKKLLSISLQSPKIWESTPVSSFNAPTNQTWISGADRTISPNPQSTAEQLVFLFDGKVTFHGLISLTYQIGNDPNNTCDKQILPVNPP